MNRQPHRRDVLHSLGAELLSAAGGGAPHSPGCVTSVTLEPHGRAGDADYLRQVGNTVTRGASAVVHAAAFNPSTGATRAAGQ